MQQLPKWHQKQSYWFYRRSALEGWEPGYLDFTQAFHSGDEISRLLYAELPPEGLPGVQNRQLLTTEKTLLWTVGWAISMVQTSPTNSSEPGI